MDARTANPDILTAIAPSVKILNLGCPSVAGITERQEANVARFIARMWPNHRNSPTQDLDEVAMAYKSNFGGHESRMHVTTILTEEGRAWNRIWKEVDVLLGRYIDTI